MDKHMSTKTYLISPLMILFLITQVYVSNSFIVGTGPGFHKCYYSDVSHDKTLQIRFGFPRKQKQNCTMSLSIDFQHHKQFSDQEIQKKDIQLYNDIFHCASMSPRQLFVYKHTPTQSQYSGSYRICVTSIQDHNQNNNTLFQLIISQKYDPALMADMLSSPLVNSAEIVDLQAIVVQIKRTLSWCQVRVKEAENVGEKLIGGLKEASRVNQNMTYIQILFLIGYGIVWLIVVKQIFGNK